MTTLNWNRAISEEFSETNKNKMLQVGDVITVRTGYPGISAVVTKKFSVVLPSLKEQHKTCELVHSISKNIECVEYKLTQTKNLKKSLMADLLTGRVRVKL